MVDAALQMNDKQIYLFTNKDNNKQIGIINFDLHLNQSNEVFCFMISPNDSKQMTLHNLLHHGAKVQPNSEIVTALRNGTTFRITTLELKNKSTQLTSALDSFGIKPGDVVGSFMWANWRHCMLYQSLPLMGSVLHTLNIRLHTKIPTIIPIIIPTITPTVFPTTNKPTIYPTISPTVNPTTNRHINTNI